MARFRSLVGRFAMGAALLASSLVVVTSAVPTGTASAAPTVGSGSGLADLFEVVNESPSPVRLVTYLTFDGRSLDDSLSRGPAPGTVLELKGRATFAVTEYFAAENRLDVVFSQTQNPTIQYRVALVPHRADSPGVPPAPVCVASPGAGCTVRSHWFPLFERGAFWIVDLS